MQEWFRISLLLSTFGFLKEIRPSEPFITDFLTGPWRNITAEQVYRDVFPVGTYSYLAQLVLVFLVTDMLRYKPLIILSGIAGVAVWSMLIWTTSLEALQLVEFFYGTYMATEVAYYTYIYAKVEKEHYQKVTAHTRAAILCGRFIAAVVAQILVFTKLMDFRQLNYISVAAQALSTAWALLLPPVKRSLYFHRTPNDERKSPIPLQVTDCCVTPQSIEKLPMNNDTKTSKDPASNNRAHMALLLLWKHFVSAYTDSEVIQWSLWYACAMCGFFQVQSYIQILWQVIEPDLEQSAIWNGAVEAVLTLLGAGGALLAGRLDLVTFRGGLVALAVCSLLEGGAVLLAATTNILWVSYVGYVTFGVLYMFMITIASTEIAKHIMDDSFGLVFGINTLLALAFQSILTGVVISENGLGLYPRQQFIVYGGYFVVLGIVYFGAAVSSCVKINGNSSRNENIADITVII